MGPHPTFCMSQPILGNRFVLVATKGKVMPSLSCFAHLHQPPQANNLRIYIQLFPDQEKNDCAFASYPGYTQKGCLHLFFSAKFFAKSPTLKRVVEGFGVTGSYRLYAGNRFISSKKGE